MSDSDIAAILHRLDVLNCGLEELKVELQAVKSWQTVRDNAAHDSAIRRDAYWRLVRWAMALWRNDFGKFLVAGALAWVGLRTV